MPTQPTSMIKRLRGEEAFTDALTLAAGTTFGGKTVDSANSLVTAITTLGITKALHDGKTILLSLAAGFISTLPTATGSGMFVRLMQGVVTTSSGTYVIKAPTATDIFVGSIYIGVTPAATGKFFNPGATDNTITLDHAHLGGTSIGDWLEFRDIAANVWSVAGLVSGSATVTTPFSHL